MDQSKGVDYSAWLVLFMYCQARSQDGVRGVIWPPPKNGQIQLDRKIIHA